MRHEPVDAKSQKRHRVPHNLNEAILETFPEFMSSIFLSLLCFERVY
jgi:hypothetical protein